MLEQPKDRMFKQRLAIAGLVLGILAFAGGAGIAAKEVFYQVPAGETVPRAGEIAIVDREANPLPTPDPLAERYLIETTETDLATLQNELHFTVLMPQYLPNGARLVSVKKLTGTAPSVGPGAELRYVTGDGRWFTITQTAPQPAGSLSIDSRAAIQMVNINGKPGVIYDPGGPDQLPVRNRAILEWLDGTRMIEIRGANVDYSTWIQVAQSLR